MRCKGMPSSQSLAFQFNSLSFLFFNCLSKGTPDLTSQTVLNRYPSIQGTNKQTNQKTKQQQNTWFGDVLFKKRNISITSLKLTKGSWEDDSLEWKVHATGAQGLSLVSYGGKGRCDDTLCNPRSGKPATGRSLSFPGQPGQTNRQILSHNQ